MELRDYQRKAYDSIIEQYDNNKSTLAVMATGTGKTVLFAHLIKHFAERGRVMVITHREELLQQAARTIRNVTGIESDIEKADQWADATMFDKTRCIIASVQSLSSGARGAARLERFNPSEFSLVVCDEVHHVTADTWQRAVSHFQRNPELKVFGCTATPDRADEQALGQIIESVAYEYEVDQAIRDGWLVPIRSRAVYVDSLDFSQVRTTAGDLNGADLAAVMEEEANLHKIADPLFSLAAGRQTLVFTVSIAQAERLSEILNRHMDGCARFISGKTPEDERALLFKQFKDGDFGILVNCMICTEGYDNPGIQVVAMARPTKSRALFAQMLGRGTRCVIDLNPFAGPAERRQAIAASPKPFVELIDFVGNSGRHDIISTADVLGGKYSDSVIKAVKAKAEHNATSEDILEALEQEKQRQAQQAIEAERRRHVVGKTKFSSSVHDIFSLLKLEPHKQRGWDTAMKLSEKQKAILLKCKVDPETLSYSQGKQLVIEYCRRVGAKLCTPGQLRCLKKFGYQADNWSFAKASRAMDLISKNNWKPVPESMIESGNAL